MDISKYLKIKEKVQHILLIRNILCSEKNMTYDCRILKIETASLHYSPT